MNKQICIIILLLTCRICDAQNLVPNGDFEQYLGCPSWAGQIDSALFWRNPSVNTGMADYFQQCALDSFVGVPKNFAGYQQPHSGVAYAGLVDWGGNSYREYIETQLTSTLVSNGCYHFEMYISQGNNYPINNSDDIQIYFSDTIVSGINNAMTLPFTPQVSNSNGNFPDTLNWTLVSGDYTANGGENYLVIGNFKSDSTTTVTGFPKIVVYFFIDDVSLSICTSIDEQNQIYGINIFPNPISDKLNVTEKNNDLSEIVLYDIASRKILQQKFTNSVTLNTQQLAKGLYLYEVWNKNGLCKKGKVVKD